MADHRARVGAEDFLVMVVVEGDYHAKVEAVEDLRDQEGAGPDQEAQDLGPVVGILDLEVEAAALEEAILDLEEGTLGPVEGGVDLVDPVGADRDPEPEEAPGRSQEESQDPQDLGHDLRSHLAVERGSMTLVEVPQIVEVTGIEA